MPTYSSTKKTLDTGKYDEKVLQQYRQALSETAGRFRDTSRSSEGFGPEMNDEIERITTLINRATGGQNEPEGTADGQRDMRSRSQSLKRDEAKKNPSEEFTGATAYGDRRQSRNRQGSMVSNHSASTTTSKKCSPSQAYPLLVKPEFELYSEPSSEPPPRPEPVTPAPRAHKFVGIEQRLPSPLKVRSVTAKAATAKQSSDGHNALLGELARLRSMLADHITAKQGIEKIELEAQDRSPFDPLHHSPTAVESQGGLVVYLNQQCQTMSAAITELERRLGSSGVQNETLRGKLNAVHHRNMELTQQLREEEILHRTCKDQVQTLEAQLQQRDELIRALKFSAQDSLLEITRSHSRGTDAKGRRRSTSPRGKRSPSQSDSARAALKELKGEAKELRVTCEKLREEYDGINREIGRLDEITNQRKAEVAALQSDVDRLQQEREKKKGECEASAMEAAKLEATLDRRKQELEDSVAEIARLAVTFERRQNECNTEMSRMSTLIDKRQGECDGLQTELLRLLAEVDKRHTELRALSRPRLTLDVACQSEWRGQAASPTPSLLDTPAPLPSPVLPLAVEAPKRSCSIGVSTDPERPAKETQTGIPARGDVQRRPAMAPLPPDALRSPSPRKAEPQQVEPRQRLRRRSPPTHLEQSPLKRSDPEWDMSEFDTHLSNTHADVARRAADIAHALRSSPVRKTLQGPTVARPGQPYYYSEDTGYDSLNDEIAPRQTAHIIYNITNTATPRRKNVSDPGLPQDEFFPNEEFERLERADESHILEDRRFSDEPAQRAVDGDGEAPEHEETWRRYHGYPARRPVYPVAAPPAMPVAAPLPYPYSQYQMRWRGP